MEKEFTQEQIRQFRSNLYSELISIGESEKDAEAIASHLDNPSVAKDIMHNHTPYIWDIIYLKQSKFIHIFFR